MCAYLCERRLYDTHVVVPAHLVAAGFAAAVAVADEGAAPDVIDTVGSLLATVFTVDTRDAHAPERFNGPDDGPLADAGGALSVSSIYPHGRVGTHTQAFID
jgi:hypothetical protein